jgi:photosystem II stability/assembly factor-like uncharacterized protein
MLKRWWIAVGSFALVSLPAMNLGCSGGGAVESDAADSTAAVSSHSDASHKKAPKLTPQQSNTVNGLIGISPVSKKVVWASGRNGTFLRTTDGGKHWTAGVVPGAETLQVRDVQGVSDKVAYLLSIGAVDADFRIYKTTDGGNSWTLQFQNQLAGGFYDCFAFWSPSKGITMADSNNGRFPVIRTLDGQTWQDIGDRLPPPLPGEAGFAASGTCAATQGKRKAWLATGGTNTVARILSTRDRGQTWTAAEVPLTVGTSFAGGATSVGFRDGRHGFAAGGDLAVTDIVDNFARSRDGGKTWKLATSAPIGGAIYGAAYAIDRDEGWGDDHWDWDWDWPWGWGHGNHHDDHDGVKVVATSPLGTAWSTDEGDSWTIFDGVTGFWAVAFADEKTGWLVGVNGTITKIEF